MLSLSGRIWSLVEQGAISGINLGSVIILGVLLSNDAFSAYVIVFATVTFSYLISTSMWGTPVLVYGVGIFKDSMQQYYWCLHLCNAITSVILAIVMLFVADFFVCDISIKTMVLAVIFSTSWNSYEILRKFAYTLKFTKFLSFLSLYLFLGYVLCVLFYNRIVPLDVNSSIFILSVQYLATTISGSILLRNKLSTARLRNGLVLIIKKHWVFSRWILAGMFGFWGATQGYILVVASLLSDVEIGGLRSAQNITGIVSIFLVLFENIVTPEAAKTYIANGVEGLSVYVRFLYRKCFVPFVVLVFFATSVAFFLFDLIYSGKFSDSKNQILIFGLYQLILGISRPSVVALRATESTRYFFLGHIIACVVACTLGLFLTWLYGGLGAAIGFVASAAALAVVLVCGEKQILQRLRGA